MTSSKLIDAAFVFGALVFAFGAIAIALAPGLTGFGLWPDYLKLAVWAAVFTGLAFAWGYSLAWARREDRGG